MDKDTRYNMLAKLSEFYVKDVKPNIKALNQARLLFNFMHIINFVLLLSIATFIVSVVNFMFLHNLEQYNINESVNGFITFIANINKSVFCVCFLFIFVFALIYNVLRFIVQIIDNSSKFHVIPNGASIYYYATNNSDIKIKSLLMRKFVKIFGNFNWCHPDFMPDSTETEKSIRESKILNNFIYTYDDYIKGTYKDLNVKIVEINTSFFNKNVIIDNTLLIIFLIAFLQLLGIIVVGIWFIKLFIKQITYKGFNGLIVEVDMKKNFNGHTFIIEKNNIEKFYIKEENFQEVILEDVEFNREYNVYSQDQIEARYILTTAFIERLKNIKKICNAKYVRVAFKDKKIIIAIHTNKNMFQLADLISDIGEKTFVQSFEEICSILEIIDTLKLNDNLGL